MTTKIDQKAYLQKYLGGRPADKKKKKKKVVKGQGFKIIDDDLDYSKLRALEGDELDILDEGEDGPQIAGIIDERPDEIKKLEQFKTTSKWRVINQDDGFNSKLQIEEIKKDVKEQEKENELIFGKMYSDSEDEKNKDSDLSPPRKDDKQNYQNTNRHSDSDFSPPRRKPSPKNESDNKYDSDLSPPRKKERGQTRKKSRWEQIDEDAINSNYNANASPHNRKRDKKSRKSRKTSSSSDLSPPRRSNKKEYKSDSDASPPRKSRREASKRNDSPDSDLSPPRPKHSPKKQYVDSKNKKNHESRPDNRRRSPNNKRKSSNNRRISPDSRKRSPNNNRRSPDNRRRSPDNSRRSPDNKTRSPEPQRKDKHKEYKRNRSPDQRSNHWNKDTSKNRRDDNQFTYNDRRHTRVEDKRNNRNDDSPPPSNIKMAKTLEGKRAGLQDAFQLRKENEAFRRREEEAFSKMTDDISGRNAKAVSRKSKRETSEERQKLIEKAERQKELDEKYKKWSKGIKQIEAQEARVQEYMHEAAKPLARHKDDQDLEENLKQIERAGDPMLQYIREKRVERGEVAPEKPKYRGNFPPNRFNIRPGYRWDGVDRSNGYEKKYFEQQSKKRALEEEAYKWSTEDL